MVHPDHVADLKEALLNLLESNGVKPNPIGSKLRELMLVFFHGKRMFPSPQQLRDAGFQHPILEFNLSAGECLIADGGFVHWGINQDSRTSSLATNVLPEDWLKVRRMHFSSLVLAAHQRTCCEHVASAAVGPKLIALCALLLSCSFVGGTRVHCESVEVGPAAS